MKESRVGVEVEKIMFSKKQTICDDHKVQMSINYSTKR